jgi:peptide/nickel transport system substrate-binding protein
MIHDLSPEGMFSIVEEEDTVRGWFPGFPYAHPDPTLPMFIFNHQHEKFQDHRVRWALALMLDARGLSMASYRGAATLSAISIPPTGTHPDDYHIPMQEELINFELDTGESVIKPYNPDMGLEIAELVRPEFGDEVPTEEDAIRRSFGYGWWNQNLDAAAELLRTAGFTEDGGGWTMPNGEPFEFTLMVPAEGVINRLGGIAAQMWSEAGVPVTAEVNPGSQSWDRQSAGDYEANVAWSVETWGGHPDRARPDHRGNPHRPLRGSRAQRRAGPRVRQAPSAGNAEHSGDVVQRVRGDV